MKTTNLASWLVLFLFPFIFISCEDDEVKIVTLNVSSTPVYYTSSFWTTWPMEGMAVTEDEEPRSMSFGFKEIDGFTYERGYEYILLAKKMPIDPMLQDTPSAYYELESVVSKVKKEITYGSFGVIVRKVVPDIVGAGLTDAEKEQLAVNVLSERPGVGGGYMFVYTQPDDKAGKVLIYNEKYGMTTVDKEGVFTQKYTVSGTEPFITYTFILDSSKEEYSVLYNKDETSLPGGFYAPFVLKVDLTEKYKVAYPAVESVSVLEYVSLEFNLFSEMI